MKRIKQLIAELLKISSVECESNFDSIHEKMDKQDEIILELNNLAKENNTIVGRVIKFQMADSYAIHLITKVTTKTATLEWIDYCDGWCDERLGEVGELPIAYCLC
jgi:hypothetical protein